MRLDPNALVRSFDRARSGKESRHAVTDRVSPSIFQYDYLALKTLSDDIAACIAGAPIPRTDALALDMGAGRSPYRRHLEARGYTVKTLDSSPGSGADFVGDAADSGLPDGLADLVLCTQVLEHTSHPGRVMQEMHRILRPGGLLIASAPHVWFYHPHPGDYWRFTQEGIVQLCEDGAFQLLELHGQGGSVLTLFQVCNFLLYGAVGRIGGPAFGVLNLMGRLLDRAVPNELLCHNFVWLARRR